MRSLLLGLSLFVVSIGSAQSRFVDATDPGCTTAEACQARCDKGALPACRQLGTWYADGDGVAADAKRGLALLRKACTGKDARACTEAGAVLAEGKPGVPVDQSGSAALFKKACDGKDLYGCAQLGRAMIHGEGVAKDVAAAAKLLETTCLPSFPAGCSAAGDALFALGNVKASAARFEQACNADVFAACVNLGAQVESGAGVPRDAKRAKALFERACKGGNEKGCQNAATTK